LIDRNLWLTIRAAAIHRNLLEIEAGEDAAGVVKTILPLIRALSSAGWPACSVDLAALTK
jgi:hypothetical protein